MSARPTPDQSTLDALADAEQLLTYYRSETFEPINYALIGAQMHGTEAVKQMGWTWGIEHGLADGAARHAQLAAGDAHVAVPGLRPDSTERGL